MRTPSQSPEGQNSASPFLSWSQSTTSWAEMFPQIADWFLKLNPSNVPKSKRSVVSEVGFFSVFMSSLLQCFAPHRPPIAFLLVGGGGFEEPDPRRQTGGNETKLRWPQ